jgi:hypothetical protein
MAKGAETADHGLLIGLDQPGPASGAEPAVLEDGERVDGDPGGNRRFRASGAGRWLRLSGLSPETSMMRRVG